MGCSDEDSRHGAIQSSVTTNRDLNFFLGSSTVCFFIIKGILFSYLASILCGDNKTGKREHVTLNVILMAFIDYQAQHHACNRKTQKQNAEEKIRRENLH